MRNIKLLLMDCDGVLTDGRLYFSAQGEELKVFHVRDGQGLALWHQAGFQSGIISGRDAGDIIRKRAEELGIKYVYVKSSDKIADFEKIIADAGVAPDEVAFVGDDIGDLGLMERVGLAVAVADAVAEVREAADHVTKADGGHGAIREVVDLLLTERTA
ncbi:MAG TPA: HAD hydrolase family protein [Pyrinomonadaceae bacterium]|nr:HAD hydrolase family protein [Pyrinomonadaceae bacterium]